MGELREAVGFLCRWLLLFLAAAAVVAALGGVLAGTAPAGQTASRMFVPDELAAGTRKVYVRGLVLAGVGEVTVPLLFQSADGCLSKGYAERESLYVEYHPPGPGSHRIVLQGMPYGPLTYERARNTVVIAAPAQPVFLVDARMAQELAEQRLPDLKECALLLGRRGVVAFFHPGRANELDRARAGLRRLGFDTPVVGSAKSEPGAMDAILRVGSATKQKPTVITSDAALARQAAGQGFRTELVGALPIGGPSAMLHVHESLEKFKASLGAQPIAP